MRVTIDDGLYVVSDDEHIGCIGVGDTEKDAIDEFNQNLKEWLKAKEELNY